MALFRPVPGRLQPRLTPTPLSRDNRRNRSRSRDRDRSPLTSALLKKNSPGIPASAEENLRALHNSIKLKLLITSLRKGAGEIGAEAPREGLSLPPNHLQLRCVSTPQYLRSKAPFPQTPSTEDPSRVPYHAPLFG